MVPGLVRPQGVCLKRVKILRKGTGMRLFCVNETLKLACFVAFSSTTDDWRSGVPGDEEALALFSFVAVDPTATGPTDWCPLDKVIDLARSLSF